MTQITVQLSERQTRALIHATELLEGTPQYAGLEAQMHGSALQEAVARLASALERQEVEAL